MRKYFQRFDDTFHLVSIANNVIKFQTLLKEWKQIT